jgi:bifunctional non-homologous end joining protein LigD
VPWEFVTDTALTLRDMLANEGLDSGRRPPAARTFISWCRWTAPVPPIRAACSPEGIVQRLAATDPDRYTIAADPKKREGRIFLDYLRNGRGTTAIGAWSPRARPGFLTARPVTWREVENGIRADPFTITRLAGGDQGTTTTMAAQPKRPWRR